MGVPPTKKPRERFRGAVVFFAFEKGGGARLTRALRSVRGQLGIVALRARARVNQSSG